MSLIIYDIIYLFILSGINITRFFNLFDIRRTSPVSSDIYSMS